MMLPPPTRPTVVATAAPPAVGFSVTVVELTVAGFRVSLKPTSMTNFVDTPVAALAGFTPTALGATVLVFATVVNDPSYAVSAFPFTSCADAFKNTWISAPVGHGIDGVNWITCPFSVTWVVPLTSTPFWDTSNAPGTVETFIGAFT